MLKCFCTHPQAWFLETLPSNRSVAARPPRIAFFYSTLLYSTLLCFSSLRFAFLDVCSDWPSARWIWISYACNWSFSIATCFSFGIVNHKGASMGTVTGIGAHYADEIRNIDYKDCSGLHDRAGHYSKGEVKRSRHRQVEYRLVNGITPCVFVSLSWAVDCRDGAYISSISFVSSLIRIVKY